MHPERVLEQIIVRTMSQNVVTIPLDAAYLHPFRVHHDFDSSVGDARKASRHPRLLTTTPPASKPETSNLTLAHSFMTQSLTVGLLTRMSADTLSQPLALHRTIRTARLANDEFSMK